MSSDYLIDDGGYYGAPGTMLNVKEGESDSIADYCLERGFFFGGSGSNFVGTIGAHCLKRVEFACLERPCVSLCCEIGMYFDTESGRCEPGIFLSIILRPLLLIATTFQFQTPDPNKLLNTLTYVDENLRPMEVLSD